jgi:hypothetical protein
MSKTRISFSFNSYQLPLFNIASTQKGDCYIAFPICSSGLHVSLHASGKVHIRDKFGFDEPMNFNTTNGFDANELTSYLRKIAYNPDHGEDVLVLSYPENYEGYVQQSSNKSVNLDIKSALNDALISTPLYQVPVEKLPKYYQRSPLETHMVLDETNNSIAIYNKRHGVSLNFSMEVNTFGKEIESMPFLRDIMQPIKRAIDHTNKLVSQGEIRSQIIPKETESNIDFELNKLQSKIKIKRFN